MASRRSICRSPSFEVHGIGVHGIDERLPVKEMGAGDQAHDDAAGNFRQGKNNRGKTMLRAGTGISVSHNPRTAAIEACAAAMTQAGLAQAAGAIFFATTAHGGAFPLILRTIGEQTKTREVVGCSSRRRNRVRVRGRKRPALVGAGVRRRRGECEAVVRAVTARIARARSHSNSPRRPSRRWDKRICFASSPIPTT